MGQSPLPVDDWGNRRVVVLTADVLVHLRERRVRAVRESAWQS